MSRLFLIPLFLLVGIIANGQTLEAEKEIIKGRLLRGEIDQETYVKEIKEFQSLLDEFGGYPKFPINTETGLIEFKYTYNLPGLDKKTIFARVLQFAAIQFASIGDVLHYQDFEFGKCVFKGWFEVPYSERFRFFGERKVSSSIRCYITLVATVKEGKVKLEAISPRFEYSALSNENFSSVTHQRSIDYYLPITNGYRQDWKERVEILKNTELNIIALLNELALYIKDSKEDYNF